MRSSSPPLEPRVAKLEAGLDILTKNVNDLTIAVRDNAVNLEDKIERLTIAVTQAQAPRRTDWSTIFAGIMLVLAIGSAVFWPLNQTAQDNKTELQEVHNDMVSHTALDNHPVGAALVQRLEEQAKLHRDADDKERETIRVHFHEELELITKNYQQQLSALEAKVNLHNDRLYARVVKVEDTVEQAKNSDLNELRLWRLRAMSGDITSKNSISTDIIFDPHVSRITEPNTVAPPTPVLPPPQHK